MARYEIRVYIFFTNMNNEYNAKTQHVLRFWIRFRLVLCFGYFLFFAILLKFVKQINNSYDFEKCVVFVGTTLIYIVCHMVCRSTSRHLQQIHFTASYFTLHHNIFCSKFTHSQHIQPTSTWTSTTTSASTLVKTY